MKNIKLNNLIKSNNNLNLNTEESNELKKNIAMELLVSPLFLIECYTDNQYQGFICNDESVLLFTDEEYLNDFLKENPVDNLDFNVKTSFIKIFIEYNKLSEKNISVLLNKGSDVEYLLTTSDFIFLDEVSCMEEYYYYKKADSIKYLKKAIKNQKNIDLVNSISHGFSEEMISSLANSELLLPVFSSNLIEKEGVIDIENMEESLNLAILKFENKEFLIAFTDKEELISHDKIFLAKTEANNRDYYIQVRPFINLVDLVLEKDLDGLIININSDKSVMIEKSKLDENYNNFMTNLNPKLLNCSFLALNHLYL